MHSEKRIFNNIERLGEKYCEKYLSCWKTSVLEKNWWEALKFFFSHSFMRGRRDKLSNEYYFFTRHLLEDTYNINNTSPDEAYRRLTHDRVYFDKRIMLDFKKSRNLMKKNSIKHPDFKSNIASKNPIIKLFVTSREVEIEWDNEIYRKTVRLGNDTDIMMVLDVLKFISSEPQRKNIYAHLKHKIEKEGVKNVFDMLVSSEFRGISDKIASFTIRDILMMNPRLEIGQEDYLMTFPIDTWVIKISKKMGFDSKNIEKVKIYFLEKCINYRIDPLKFNAGLWYLGFHSLDILLEQYLGKIKI